MTKENHFSRKMVSMTNAELQRYIDNKSHYDQDAVLAAIWELEKRGEENDDSTELEKKIKSEKQTKKRLISKHLGIPVNTAKPETRLVHYIIDGFAVSAIVLLLNILPFIEIAQLFVFLLYPAYYIFFEYHYQWTLGKLASNTIVVDKNGERPPLQAIIVRTFARYVPFEPLTCLGQNSWGWHDRWSETYVIDKKDLDALREAKNLPPIQLTPLKISKQSYILIGIIAALILISSLLTQYTNSKIEQYTSSWVSELEGKNYNKLEGSWNTGNDQLNELNFVNKELVLSKKGESVQSFTYNIENSVLTISGSNFSIQFVIMEFKNNSLSLVEINDKMSQVTWYKKQTIK